MSKLHADCILLKRILDRRSQRHEADLASVNTVITTLQGPDAEIVKEYKRRLEEKREKDVRIMKDYAEKMHAFLSEMYPALYKLRVCSKQPQLKELHFLHLLILPLHPRDNKDDQNHATSKRAEKHLPVVDFRLVCLAALHLQPLQQHFHPLHPAHKARQLKSLAQNQFRLPHIRISHIQLNSFQRRPELRVQIQHHFALLRRQSRILPLEQLLRLTRLLHFHDQSVERIDESLHLHDVGPALDDMPVIAAEHAVGGEEGIHRPELALGEVLDEG